VQKLKELTLTGRWYRTESVGGVNPPATGVGTLAVELSRRVHRHGAIFANPGKWVRGCLVISNLLRY